MRCQADDIRGDRHPAAASFFLGGGKQEWGPHTKWMRLMSHRVLLLDWNTPGGGQFNKAPPPLSMLETQWGSPGALPPLTPQGRVRPPPQPSASQA